MHDVLQTFFPESGEDAAFTISETFLSKDDMYDTDMQCKMFLDFWKSKMCRSFKIDHYRKKSRILLRFMKKAGVSPESVCEAVWLKQNYTLQEFMKLFLVSDNEAHHILGALGYQKKTVDNYYRLLPDRKEILMECIEATSLAIEESCTDVGRFATCQTKYRRAAADLMRRFSGWAEDFAGRISYPVSENAEWNEPAYGERKARRNTVITVALVIGMLLMAIVLLGMFVKEFNSDGRRDSLYNFWGAIVGAVIAGLVTILTTYLIIQRSYKVDYHQERIAALPIFHISIARDHFPMEEELPEFLQDIMKRYEVSECGRYRDSMLVEMTNIGKNIAFNVAVSGSPLWPDYDNPTYQSMVSGEKVYFIVESCSEMTAIVKYYDVYGNFYYQKFEMQSSFYNSENKKFVCRAPELVLRTNRVRYIQ